MITVARSQQKETKGKTYKKSKTQDVQQTNCNSGTDMEPMNSGTNIEPITGKNGQPPLNETNMHVTSGRNEN